MMTSTPDSCKDGDSNNDDVCGDVIEKLQITSAADNNDNINVSVCANCGKEGDDVNNICNKCKLVKYCNAACKKKHRHKHKKDCEEHLRLAAERAAKLHDEQLFKQPPPEEDCPICFLPLPSLEWGTRYKTCCGKMICSGCVYAPVYDNQGNKVDNKKCPFCRIPSPSTDEEIDERYKKRMLLNDPIAIYNQGNYYRDGRNGFSHDHVKALELYHRAAELGYYDAYVCIGASYNIGRGVEVDKMKAKHYYELAAMGGNEVARCNLGKIEANLGNFDRALKHFMIAVRGGWSGSLVVIKDMYSKGWATKEDYTKALQLYQTYLGEIKSPQRDEAAAADEEYRYY